LFYVFYYRDLEHKREVERIEGEDFSCTNSLLFYETSAKTASNVSEVFEELAIHLYKRVLNGEIDVHRPVQIYYFLHNTKTVQTVLNYDIILIC